MNAKTTRCPVCGIVTQAWGCSHMYNPEGHSYSNPDPNCTCTFCAGANAKERAA
jgi:hypothetical protein